METRHCAKCGAAFVCRRTGTTRYCSAACRWTDPVLLAHRREKSKAAWADPAKAAKILAGIDSRSKDPAWLSAPHFQPEEASPRFKVGRPPNQRDRGRYAAKKFRKLVLDRDGHTCQVCGSKHGRMFAHHIKSWDDFPELRYVLGNGQTMCKRCHERLHDKTLKHFNVFCSECGQPKSDRRSLRCHSCASKQAFRDDLRTKAKACGVCGKDFKPRRSTSVYCSRACQGIARRAS